MYKKRTNNNQVPNKSVAKVFPRKASPPVQRNPKDLKKFQKAEKKKLVKDADETSDLSQNKQKITATTFQIYIHSAGPEFRDLTLNEAKACIQAAAPRRKLPKFIPKGQQGLLVKGTLRDIYILSHGLRTADDLMIQLGRPQSKIGSFNRFIATLDRLPLHAFAPRIIPPTQSHRVGKLSPEKKKHEDMLTNIAESGLLHNNIRIITHKSILFNQPTLKAYSRETIRNKLTLRRGASLKHRQVLHTDNPVLFGKSSNEVDEVLALVEANKKAAIQAKKQQKLQLIEANKRIKKELYKKHNVEYNPEYDNDNNNNDNDDDDITEYVDLDGNPLDLSSNQPINDGKSINFNDFVDDNGQVNLDELRIALEGLVRDATGNDIKRGPNEPLFEESTLHTVASHLSQAYKEEKALKDTTTTSASSSSKQSTSKPTSTSTKPPVSQEQIDQHIAVLDQRKMQRNIVRDEAYIHGDIETLRRIQIDDEEDKYERENPSLLLSSYYNDDGEYDTDNDEMHQNVINDIKNRYNQNNTTPKNDQKMTKNDQKMTKNDLKNNTSNNKLHQQQQQVADDDNNKGSNTRLRTRLQEIIKEDEKDESSSTEISIIDNNDTYNIEYDFKPTPFTDDNYYTNKLQEYQKNPVPHDIYIKRQKELMERKQAAGDDWNIPLPLLDDNDELIDPLTLPPRSAPSQYGYLEGLDVDQEWAEVDPEWTEGEGVHVHNIPKSQRRYLNRLKAKHEKHVQEILKNIEEEERYAGMNELEKALLSISEKTEKTQYKQDKKQQQHDNIDNNNNNPILSPSLLATAYIHKGKTGTDASKRVLANAKKSIPDIYTFLPPEYRGLKEYKILRRLPHDNYLKEQYYRAKQKVFEITQRYKKRDNEVKKAIKHAEKTDTHIIPSLMIPFRPHSDVPSAAMTITLDHNNMQVSISAVGSREHALYKRGYRQHLIETSLRETIAAGVLSLAYNVMSPMPDDSPLHQLESDDYVEPIRHGLLSLARHVKIVRQSGDDRSDTAKRIQDNMLQTSVALLGHEETKKQVITALLEEQRDILTNPDNVKELLPNLRTNKDDDNMNQIDKKYIQKKKEKDDNRGLLSTDMINDTISTLNKQQIDDLVYTNKMNIALQHGDVPHKAIEPKSIIKTPLLSNDSITTAATTATTTNDIKNKNTKQVTASTVNKSDYSTTTDSKKKLPSSTSSDNTLNDDEIPLEPQSLSSLLLNNRPSPQDIISTISSLPVYHQAQAAAALAAGIPYDPIMPLPSPSISQIKTIAVHSRDHTPLNEVLAHTLSTGIIDADPSIRIYDPFCGSGTIIIESVFRFLGIPTPPRQRAFAFENWPIHNEYEYNSMMREWNIQYNDIVQQFIDKFGLTKYDTLTGKIALDNKQGLGSLSSDEVDKLMFPLFIGSDLRDKSIRASIHNSNQAKVNYFTHFFKGDFETVIRNAALKWDEYQNEQYKDYINNDNSNKHHRSSSSTSLLHPDDILNMDEYLNLPTQQILHSQNELKRQKHFNLPLTFPYLKGYTLFGNVPWGISDAKPFKPYNNNERDRNSTYYSNTTQQEPVEDLYLRLGATLHDHSNMFRDVFILSAHQKFEKLTSIGAQRAARQAENKQQQFGYQMKQNKNNNNKTQLEIRNQVAIRTEKNKGTLEWDRVATFYNQGVKTHLLKLRM